MLFALALILEILTLLFYGFTLIQIQSAFRIMLMLIVYILLNFECCTVYISVQGVFVL